MDLDPDTATPAELDMAPLSHFGAAAARMLDVKGLFKVPAFTGREAAWGCLLYTSPSPRARQKAPMPSSACKNQPK